MNDKDINQDSDNLQENIDNEQNCFELLDGSSCFIASSETDVNLLRDFILESGATLKVTNGTETRNGRTYIYNIEQGSFRTRTDAVPTRRISNIHDRYPMDRDKVGVMHIFNGLHRDPANVLRFGATNDVKTFSETFRQIGFDVEIFQPDSFQEMKDLIRYVTKQNYEDYNIFALVFIAHGGQGKFYGPKTIYSRWNLWMLFWDHLGYLGSNEFILMQEVNQLLDDNISLKNRPKLIFTESCRGSIIDTQELLEYTSDLNTNLKPKNKGRHSEIPIANLADMFWACSTVEPYVSWSLGGEVSNSHSPWINKLCELLAQDHMHTDFQEIYRKLKCHFKWNPIHIKEEENMALLATFQMPDIQMDTLVGRVLFVKDEEQNGLEGQNEHQDKEADQEDPIQNQDQNKPKNIKDSKTKKETNINNEPKDKEETNINNEAEGSEDHNEPKVEKEMEKFKHQNESKKSENFDDQNEYNELSEQKYKIETLSLGQTPGTQLSQNSFELNQDDVSKKTQNESQKNLHLNLSGAKNLENQTLSKKKMFRLPPEFNCYPMSKKIKGHALILSNEIFNNFDFPKRHGSEKDRENLDKLFGYLGFEVRSYLNTSAGEMKQRLLDFSRMDHTQDEMCIIVVTSHGDKDSVFGSDGGSVRIDYILNIFNNANCPQLMGKPKLFLFQSCRGEQIDYGVEMATKARPSLWKASSPKVPTWEDMLIVYSSVPGFVSFRNPTEGTWFIQILCKVFMEHAWDLELQDLLQIVMMEMRKKGDDGIKQSFSYEIRHFYKKLYFNPGLFKNENEKN